VKGSWWRVLGILLLATVLTFVISSIIATPFAVVAGGGASLFSTTASTTGPGLAALFLATVGQIVGYTITYPFSAGVSVLLYVDQRMRREGLDLDLARAAGVSHPREGGHGGPTDPRGGGSPAGWGPSSGSTPVR